MSSTIKPTPSCFTCPAYLAADEAQKKFKKATGSPMCGRYGIVLGSPKHTDAKQTIKLQQHIAAKCPSYGDPMPPVPIEYRMEVAMPDIATIGHEPDPTAQAACRTCSMCKNFVRDDAVHKDLGWTTGLCAAKGKLILPNRQVYEASGCEQREYGTIRTSALGIHLLPEYDHDFGVVDPIKEFFVARSTETTPGLYETDKPVSDQDRASGIRAWRKVSDPGEPDGDRYTFLPIYDPEFFDEEDRKLIPGPNDPEHPELYVDHFGGVYLAAVAWMELDETPAANGKPGTGKTELGRYLAYLMQIPFRRISITGSTELDDLAGKFVFVNGETKFVYGRLPDGWGKPGVICIDEPNVGPPEVWQFIRPLTDNSKQLILDMNKGEVINRHDDCYMMMAMNPAWDALNVGTQQIGDADVNRLFHVAVPMPPQALEEEIIRQRVKLDGWEIDEHRMKMVMSIATDLRALIDDGTLPMSWAIRPQIKVARALRWFDPVTAYRRAVADYLEPEASQQLLDVVRTHIPG